MSYKNRNQEERQKGKFYTKNGKVAFQSFPEETWQQRAQIPTWDLTNDNTIHLLDIIEHGDNKIQGAFLIDKEQQRDTILLNLLTNNSLKEATHNQFFDPSVDNCVVKGVIIGRNDAQLFYHAS